MPCGSFCLYKPFAYFFAHLYNTSLKQLAIVGACATPLTDTFIDMGMAVLEVDDWWNVWDGDVGDLFSLDVDKDEALAGVVGVLDVGQLADDLGDHFVNFVVCKVKNFYVSKTFVSVSTLPT